jgi:hypothetical protein
MSTTGTYDSAAFTASGRDELDERGFTDYPLVALEVAKARHLAAAMDRLDQAVTGAGPALRAWAADAGHTRLAVPFGLSFLAVLWLVAGMVMEIGGAR